MTDLPRVQSFDEFEDAALSVIKPFRSKFGAVWFHEAGNKPARRDWLVKDLIEARSFGIVYGPPGCGKSFLLTDLMLTCAAAILPYRENARDWFGHRVNPCGVVYVVAEGADDFVIRLHAWRLNQAINVDDIIPFVFLPTSIDLRTDESGAQQLTEEIQGIDREMREKCGVGVGAVVIDTVSRALAGGNENASEVMGAFVKNCGLIQKVTNAAVICVHHGGKEGGRGPRGHESLLGAADFTIEVAGRGEERATNQWTVAKMKAGAGGAKHDFTLRQLTVDYDEDEAPITSCVVVNQEAEPETKKPKGIRVNQGEIEFLRVLSEAIQRFGVMPSTDLNVPTNVRLVVHVDKVRELFKSRYAVTESGTPKQIEVRLRKRWGRATKAMIKVGIIASSQPWLWFTGRLPQGVRIAGADPIDDNPDAPRDLLSGAEAQEGSDAPSD